ncbi:MULTISPECIES: FixH family protein [Oceanimonas]|uniref:FixH family protein n=1 Tax=Oceanimonas smirnovii TaxID=264574 RepID=A0ABW7P194_9GAMM|nr:MULTISPECIES: FixH family protein [Oceanimonas]MDV2856922.1 FixH family protein [Oceanimonas sp. CAM02]
MQRPWYQQFWPWFLIVLPACVVVASLYTFYLANSHADSMVVDDYYKKGRAINQDLSELKEAERLGLIAELKLENGEIAIRMQGEHEAGEAIYLRLSHPTLEAQDVQALLSSDANGIYRLRPDHELLKGKWHLQLEAFDKRWRLQNTVYLPSSDWLQIRAGS